MARTRNLTPEELEAGQEAVRKYGEKCVKAYVVADKCLIVRAGGLELNRYRDQRDKGKGGDATEALIELIQACAVYPKSPGDVRAILDLKPKLIQKASDDLYEMADFGIEELEGEFLASATIDG